MLTTHSLGNTSKEEWQRNKLIDIWRERNAGTKAFTSKKKQTTNRTKARLDYYRISKNTEGYITDAHIGRTSILSDHRPIFVMITPATTPMGRGFWKFDNTLLRDTNSMTGCNLMMKTIMKRHSQQIQEVDNPKDVDYTQAK